MNKAIARVHGNGRVHKAVGRPTKLTPAIAQGIYALIRDGNYVETACAASGISKQTYYTWLDRGREDRATGRQSQFRMFLDDVELAEAYAQVAMVKEIRDEPGGNRWLAARRWRSLFGDQVTLTHEHKELSADQIRKLLFGNATPD